MNERLKMEFQFLKFLYNEYNYTSANYSPSVNRIIKDYFTYFNNKYKDKKVLIIRDNHIGKVEKIYRVGSTCYLYIIDNKGNRHYALPDNITFLS